METICQVEADLLSLRTEHRFQLIDLTPRIVARVRSYNIRDGIAIVSSLHTTFALFVNEVQEALLADIESFLEQVVSDSEYWKHNDPRFSDCDRRNAGAHLRAMLLGHTLTVPVRDGSIALGTYQALIGAELDGPRQRSLQIHVLGV